MILITDSWQLFTNAILQSGTPLLLSAITRDEASRRTQEVLSSIGCANDTSSNAEAALCAQNSPHINSASGDLYKQISKGDRFIGLGVTSFPPVIDGRVLTDSPVNLLASGDFKKCPVMTGYLIDEGAIFAGYSSPV